VQQQELKISVVERSPDTLKLYARALPEFATAFV
jgi:hypothetical protein